jgi:SAM-dependent methyltransferase
MSSDGWDSFYRITKDSPPWSLMIRAAEVARAKGQALDLGAGAGRDTRYLLAQGFQVTAVDAQADSVALLATLAPQGAPERLLVIKSTFEDFPFETSAYDLINAQFALPFVARDHFFAVFSRIKAGLTPGGVFAGQFFGVHDEWNVTDTDMTFLTRAEAEDQVSDLETIEFRELEEDGHVADGRPKHWHVFHILARRPQ